MKTTDIRNASGSIVILDDDPFASANQSVLYNAGLTFEQLETPEELFRRLERDPAVRLVLLRGLSHTFSSPEVCREIRRVASKVQLSVVAVLRSREFGRGAEMLLAGVNELLVEPFDAAEFSARTRIEVRQQSTDSSRTKTEDRRVDNIHSAHGQDSADAADDLIIPEFDPQTRRLTYGKLENRRAAWDRDHRVRQIQLDRILLCPECEAVATFRPGCGACGSARTENEVLMHHYACAYVGPEAEFRTDAGFVCPKCRLTDLVAGADFEQTHGCLHCRDCDAIFTELRLIGHCLACEHRFPYEEALLRDVTAYHFPAPSRPPAVNRPAFLSREAANKPVVPYGTDGIELQP
ncbi:MAG: hypothetical protein KDA89_23410 [Planctomycetaceae bacterium]|nr:hypothetical protein [Planctomycetaceae bacterium]